MMSLPSKVACLRGGPGIVVRTPFRRASGGRWPTKAARQLFLSSLRRAFGRFQHLGWLYQLLGWVSISLAAVPPFHAAAENADILKTCFQKNDGGFCRALVGVANENYWLLLGHFDLCEASRERAKRHIQRVRKTT